MASILLLMKDYNQGGAESFNKTWKKRGTRSGSVAGFS